MPWIGRWLSADPAGPVDGPNLYQYVSGNPVRLNDPSGTQEEWEYETNPETGYSQMPEETYDDEGDYGGWDDEPVTDEEDDWAGADAPPTPGNVDAEEEFAIEDYDPSSGNEPAPLAEEEYGGDIPEPETEPQAPEETFFDKVGNAWEKGSTSDKVVMAATGVGAAGGVIPYAGDYVSLLGSIVSFGAKPSWEHAGDVFLDTVGALAPFVVAMGTVRRAERIADAGDAAHDMEKAVDTIDTSKDVKKVATKRKGKKASDSSKAEKHGDAGRAQTKAEKQVAELEKKLETATGKEAKKIKTKIQNIRKTADKKKKGDTDWRKGGNTGRK